MLNTVCQYFDATTEVCVYLNIFFLYNIGPRPNLAEYLNTTGIVYILQHR